MSDSCEGGNKNDEIRDISFACVDCRQEFKSRQELIEHESTQY